jgi:hypothetical protein
MSLLDLIFKPKQKTRINTCDIININDNYITIPSLNFKGAFVSSENNKFKLAWCRNSDLEHKCNYVLIEDSNIIAKGYLISPDNGKVINNGTFLLHDNGNLNELSGTLYVFDVSGKKIISRLFKANLCTSDLSTDGRFAACQTANSGDINDSGALTVFDLTKGIELAQWYAESGWASFYTFYPNDEMIGLGDSHLGVFRYSLTGQFVDRKLWQDTCLFKGKYWHSLMMVESLINDAEGKPSLELVERLLLSMDKIAMTIPEQNQGGWQAMFFKLRGICFDSKGNLKEALACYNKALALNPKIGVKQRINKINKAINLVL